VSPPLSVLIADDELVARKRLSRLLTAFPDVSVCGEAADGEAVLEAVRAGGVDVVLLDIHMPGLSGMDALALLPAGGPHVILVTAHADHAVEAFEHGAVDYVLKPVEASRLQKALERVRVRLAAKAPEAGKGSAIEQLARPLARLPIPTRQGIVLVDPGTISHATLEDELVTVFTSQGDFLTDFTLQELVDRLPTEGFYRVHRRALVNLAHVTRLEPLETGGYLARTARGHTVEVSRQSAACSACAAAPRMSPEREAVTPGEPFIPTPSALCAAHPERPATIICARCGSYACNLCQRVEAERRAYCVRCTPELPLASPGSRLAATLVDRLASALPLAGTILIGVLMSKGRPEAEVAPLLLVLVMGGMLASMSMVAWQLYLLLTTGQSLGKRLLGIQVVRTDGSPVELGRLLLLRNLAPAVLIIPSFGLFALANALPVLTAGRRCLHDHLADTKVVVVNGPTH
jgi:two-component system, LytTR family, response regulator